MSATGPPTFIGPQAYEGWRATSVDRLTEAIELGLQSVAPSTIRGSAYSRGRDPWLGRLTNFGTVFLALSAVKP